MLDKEISPTHSQNSDIHLKDWSVIEIFLGALLPPRTNMANNVCRLVSCQSRKLKIFTFLPVPLKLTPVFTEIYNRQWQSKLNQVLIVRNPY